MDVKIIAAGLVCATVVGGGAVGVGVMNSPKIVMANAITGVVEDVVERDEIKPIYNMLKKGSLEASISSWQEDGYNYLEGQSYSGKIYFSKDALMLENVSVKIDNFQVNGSAYISSDLFYVEEDKILGDAYGVKMDEIAKDLDDSIFAYDSSSKYSLKNVMDEDTYEQLLESFEGSKNSKKMSKDAQKIAKRYSKKIAKIVGKHAEFDSQGKAEKLNSGKKNVRQVTMKIDGDAMAAIVEDVYTFLMEDNEIVEYLQKYEEEFAALNNVIGYEYDSVAEWYEETLEGFEDYIDGFCEECEKYFEPLEVSVFTPKMSSKLLKLEVEYDKDSVFMLDVGEKGIKKSDKITVEAVGTEIEYEIKTNTKESYKSKLSVDGDEVMSVNLNRSSGKYKATFGMMEASGKLEKSGNTITFELDEVAVSYGGAKMYSMTSDLSIVMQEKDKMPSAPKDYKTIAEIREKDIDKWIENVENALW